MSGWARASARGLLAVGAAALALLCAEGAASLLLGRSLRGPAAGGGTDRPAPTDRDRQLAALQNPGVYRVHPDPFVGYVLRSSTQLELAGAVVRSDALGLRARPGPPPPADALRLVVLGDSVAFGYGLGDDETLAARLEQALNALQPRPVAARTVAMPGWNHRNAFRFLLDHYTELAPDIVVYIPIGNDLYDTDGLWETGHRRAAPDLANPDPLLLVHTLPATPFLRATRAALADVGKSALLARQGPNILTADLSAESRRRYDDNVRTILLLDRRLRDEGAHLMVVRYEETRYDWHLSRRLIESGAGIPIVPLFDGVDKTLSLPDDPHANATAVHAAAQWLAADLLAQGWIGAPARPPPAAVAPEAERRRARVRADAEVVAMSRATLDSARAELQPAVDWRDATGLHQIYGTINADGSAGARLLVALKPAGATLVLELQALPEPSALYPLAVQVSVDGRPLESLELTSGDSRQWRLALPPRERAGEPLEVLLVPASWAVQDVEGSASLVSFRPLRIACEP